MPLYTTGGSFFADRARAVFYFGSDEKKDFLTTTRLARIREESNGSQLTRNGARTAGNCESENSSSAVSCTRYFRRTRARTWQVETVRCIIVNVIDRLWISRRLSTQRVKVYDV